MGTKYKTIKCNKCGFQNVKQATKCKKCGNELKTTLKTCPKCAKRNDIKVDKCVSCGYDFNKKDVPIRVNLVITLVFIAICVILLLLDKESIVEKFNKILKILAIFMIVLIVFNTLTYGKKDIVQLPGDENDSINNRFSFLRGRTLILIIVSVLIALGVIIWYLIKNYL